MAYVPKLNATLQFNPQSVVVFSKILANCENVKFVAINTAPYNIYLTRSELPDNVWVGPQDSYFGLYGIPLVKQSNAKYTINIDYGDSQELTIESKLIQTEPQAQGIASFLEQIYHMKQRAYEIEIFGNPFIQIGDIVNVIYNYGKINIDDTNKARKCLVIGINHSFDSGGLSTIIKVRLLERA